MTDDDVSVRQLRPGEEPDFLDLVDGWPFSDGRRGKTFFRKYVDGDARYRPDNVWLAEDRARGNALVSCAQIFPRDMWLGGEAVPVGGIGTVFTRPSHRRLGIAERVLEAAARDMTGRGMVLSLLSGTRARWYGRLGWTPWPGESALLSMDGATTVGGDGERFDARRHLETVVEIGNAYAQGRPGCLARNDGDWRSSLEVAGNPDEDFWVGRSRGEVVAYLRGCDLGGGWQVTEWARRHDDDSAQALARLFVRAGSAAATDGCFQAPRVADPRLQAALLREGVAVRSRADPDCTEADPRAPVWMLRPLAGVRLSASLPPTDFCFWPSDRF